MNDEMFNSGKNEQLWKEAKARADFKIHLTVYLIINSGLWALWLVTGGGELLSMAHMAQHWLGGRIGGQLLQCVPVQSHCRKRI